MKIAEEIDNPFCRVGALRALGLVLVEQGDFDDAIPFLERALRQCEQWHVDLLYSLIAGGLGYAYAITGRVDEGVALMQRAVDQRPSLRGDYPGIRRIPAHAAWRGLPARWTARGCGGVCRTRLGSRTHLRQSRRRSVVAAATAISKACESDRCRGNREAVPQKPAIAADHEMAPFVAHCDLRIGKLHASAGNDVESRAVHERAHRILGLEMPYWAAIAQRELTRVANGDESVQRVRGGTASQLRCSSPRSRSHPLQRPIPHVPCASSLEAPRKRAGSHRATPG